jgi:protein-L-isoaspartate(D-aspartate) O-methyltransferase
MTTVPRHEFVPPELAEAAYEDRPLPIGEGQTISQPYIVARMADLADIEAGDQVLEIGAGCGYAAAVLGELAQEVVTVEIRPTLAESARSTLDRLGYSNVKVVTGSIDEVDSEMRFGAVLAAAAASEIPDTLEDRLADGGRLVLPVGSRFAQHLWTVDRQGDELVRRRHEAVAFVPLV